MRHNPFSPLNYYLQMLVSSEQDAVQLMSKYSVHPPDTASGGQARGAQKNILTGVLQQPGPVMISPSVSAP
jgi:hypothetical protein